MSSPPPHKLTQICLCSKTSHRDSKGNSSDKSQQESKLKTSASAFHSNLRKKRMETTSSNRSAEYTFERASSSEKPNSSHTTNVAGIADLDNSVDAYTSNQLAHMEVDILEMSASTYAHPNEGAHDRGNPSAAYPPYAIASTSACPCHTIPAQVGDSSNSFVSGYQQAFTPLERWLNEDAGDGGPLALQLGFQVRADCTCIFMHDGMI